MQERRTRRKYFQSFCLAIGNYGCYFLCIVDIAEKVNEKKYTIQQIVDFILKAGMKGYMTFDVNDLQNKDNFYIREPHKILEMLTGKKWEVRKEPASYTPDKDEYVVEQWSTGNLLSHFARTGDGFNSLQKSIQVSNGKIVSYRIFKEVK